MFVDASDTLQAIFFQTQEMCDTFEAYPELILLDATYKLNDLHMPLYVMMNVDGNGESEIICFWLVAKEDKETIGGLMDTFKEKNSKWSRVQVIMADKDMTERDVLTHKLPQADILICLYHTLKSFRREVSIEKMGISVGERNLSLEILGKMAYAKTEEAYQEAYQDLQQSAPRAVREYFETNWHPIRGEWVDGLKDMKSNLLNRTNNRVESTNQKLKSVISRYSGITDFFLDLMKCVSVLKNERDNRAAKLDLKVPVGWDLIVGPVRQFQSHLTPYAFAFVKDQLDYSEKVCITGTEGDDSVIIKTRSGRVIEASSVSCSCSFFTAMMLPCRHILSARRHFGKPIFDANLCAERWTLAYFKSSHRIYQTTGSQQADEQGDMSVDIGVHEVRIPTSQNAVLSELQKYRKCHDVVISVAQIIVEQGMRDFNYNMALLESLRDHLQARKKVVLQESTESTSRPATASTSRPATEHTSRPATEPTPRPATEPTSRPATEHTSRPATEPTPRPATEHTSRPATESTSRPATTPTARPATQSTSRPATASTSRPATQSTSRPASGAPLQEVTTMNVVKLPKKMVKRGRPKGAGLTVIGLPARKKRSVSGPVAFRLKSPTEKANGEYNWCDAALPMGTPAPP